TEVAGVGDVEVPHRRPADEDQAIEGARVHFLAHRRPAPVALGERGRGIFHELAHGLSSESCAGLTRASIYFAKSPYEEWMDCRVKPGNDALGPRRCSRNWNARLRSAGVIQACSAAGYRGTRPRAPRARPSARRN